MNKVQNAVNLIGRTGIDPLIRTLENGRKMAKFPLATNETVISEEGKSVKTQWHNIIVWGKKAELIEKYVRKGQLMAIGGKLINNVYKDEGKNRKITEVHVNDIMLINQNSGVETNGNSKPSAKGKTKAATAGKSKRVSRKAS